MNFVRFVVQYVAGPRQQAGIGRGPSSAPQRRACDRLPFDNGVFLRSMALHLSGQTPEYVVRGRRTSASAAGLCSVGREDADRNLGSGRRCAGASSSV